jgi:hypothetical protein
MVVTRSETGTILSEPPALIPVRSISSVYARSSVATSEIRSERMGSPPLSWEAGAVQGLLDLVPTTGRGAEGVGKSDVAAPRRQLLIRLGVSLHERKDGSVILLNDPPEIRCRHFDASSTPDS